MYVLHLVFVLSTSPMNDGAFADRYLHFETRAECVERMWWWIRNREAELPGMDAAYRQLILPVPAWQCQPDQALVG